MNRLNDMVNRFEPTTPRRAMVWVLACTLVVLLAGCQSVESLAERGWQDTRHTVSRVVAALRPAPLDSALFAHKPAFEETGDAALNTALLERQIWIAGLNAGEPVAERMAVNRVRDNGVLVYRPGSRRAPAARTSRPTARTYVTQPRFDPRPAAYAPRTVESAPQARDPFAYVNLSGPSDMGDWQTCENSVGGAFIVGASGVRIADDFDACMRSRGYAPEAEAERKLELAGGLRGTSRP